MRKDKDRVLYLWPFGDWTGLRGRPLPPTHGYDRPRFRPGAWRYFVAACFLVLVFVALGAAITSLTS